MKASVVAVLAMLAFAGCMNDSEENPADTTDGNVDGMPRLYSELDSIVFNQLDFLYFINKEAEPREIFSEAARVMLTDDTLLFHREIEILPGDSTPVESTYLRTKFNPKGWFAFHDALNALACRPSEADPTGDWFIKLELSPDIHRACYRTPDTSPSTGQIWITHYQDKGFMFNSTSAVADRDLGKARIYYWR